MVRHISMEPVCRRISEPQIMIRFWSPWQMRQDPCLNDIGILVSTDPIAVDQACIDLVYACDDPGKAHFLERIESRNGIHTIEAATALGYGTREYELIEVE